MTPLKLIFIGTGEIGVRLLDSLNENPNIDLALVVTGVDKPAGRKMELQPSAIKKTALELGLEVYQPEAIKSPEAVEKLKNVAPDVILVMAYGQLLSQEVLDIPKIDCLNVHTSLLPKYRGASPIQSVILNGEKQTGITLMRMVKEMDAGPMYEQFKILLMSALETAGTLEARLAKLAAEKVPNSLVQIVEGKLEPTEQNEAEATFVTKISKADGQINWDEPAELIERKIRAFNPWPSCYTFFKGKRLKIHGAIAKNMDASAPPGTVVEKDGGVGVVTGKGILELIEVQPEGKKPQTMKEFLNGNGDFFGSKLN